ncbi:MAG: CDP-alcohol phosphatidyltransferase family protein, partial [Acidobacteriota bacterium]
MSEVNNRKRRPARRGMYILPSLFTAGSIAAGFYAIVQSLQGSPTEPHHFDHAALVIGLAIPFDGLDGRIARMTHQEFMTKGGADTATEASIDARRENEAAD